MNSHFRPGTSASQTASPSCRRWARVFTALFVVQTVLSAALAYAQLAASPASFAGNRPAFDAATTGTPIVLIAPPSAAGNDLRQLDLLARGLVLEGELSTATLRALVGANRVQYDSLAATPQAGSGAAPRFAIDIKALGGMRAGQAVLVATDKGLGVNSSGRLATLAGNLELSSNGDLVVKDTYSAGDLKFSSEGALTLNGQTVVNGEATLRAPRQVDNAGYAQAARLVIDTAHLRNSGELTQTAAATPLVLSPSERLTNTGWIYTAGDLHLASPLIVGGSGANSLLQAAGNLHLGGAATELREQSLMAGSALSIEVDSLRAQASSLRASGSLTLQAGSALDLLASQVEAGRISLRAAGPVVLDGSRLAGREQVTVMGEGIGSEGSIVEAPRLSIDAGAGALRNAGGKWLASGADAGALDIRATGVDNTGGTLQAHGGVALDLRGGALTNEHGALAGQSLRLQALGRLINANGLISTEQDLDLSVAGIDNRRGAIVSAGSLRLSVGPDGFRGDDGWLESGRSIDLQLGAADLLARASVIKAQQHVHIKAGNASLDEATLLAGQDLGLQAAKLEAADSLVRAQGSVRVTTSELRGAGSTWVGGADLRIAATHGGLDLQHARMQAGATLALQGSGLRLDHADTQAAAVAFNAGAGAFSHRNGRLLATDAAGAGLQLRAASLDNTAGVLASAVGAVLQVQGPLVNDGARIQATGALALRATALSNRAGTIVTGESLGLRDLAIDNRGGAIRSAGSLQIDTHGRAFDNTEGELLAERDLQLEAGHITAARGSLLAGGVLEARASGLVAEQADIVGLSGIDLQVDQELALRGATAASDGAIRLKAAHIDARSAEIEALGPVQAQAMQALNLSQARPLAAGERGDIDLQGGSVIAGQAQVLAAAAARLRAGTDLGLAGATVQAGAQLQADAGGRAELTAARLLAGGGLAIRASEGIRAQHAVLAAVGSVDLGGGVADFDAAGVRVHSESADITLDARQVRTAVTPPLEHGGVSPTGLTAARDIVVKARRGIDLSHTKTQANGRIHLETAEVIRNDGGQLIAGLEAAMNAESLSNQDGLIGAQEAIAIGLRSGPLHNDGGRIVTPGSLTIEAAQGRASRVSNTAGVIESGGALRLRHQVLDNTGGRIQALAGLDIEGGPIDSKAGVLATEGALRVDTGGARFNAAGATLLSTKSALSLQAGDIDLSAARVLATGPVRLHGATLRLDDSELSTGADGQLDANGDLLARNATWTLGSGLTLAATGSIDARRSSIHAAQAARLRAGEGIDLRGGELRADALALEAGAGSLDNRFGRLLAVGSHAGAMSLRGEGVVNADGAIYAAGGLYLDAGAAALQNQRGVIAAEGAARLIAAGLDNRQGTLAATGALTVDSTRPGASQRSDNTGGRIYSTAASLSLMTGELRNGRLPPEERAEAAGADSSAGGFIGADRDLRIRAAGGVDNQGGEMAAAHGELKIEIAGRLRNAAGRLTAGSELSLVAEAIDNRAGLIAGERSVHVRAARDVDNTEGRVQAASALALEAGGVVANDGGTLLAEQDLSIAANTLSNSAGLLGSRGADVRLRVDRFAAQGGAVLAQGMLDIESAGDLGQAGGQLASGGALRLRARQGQLAKAAINAGSGLDLHFEALNADEAQIQAHGPVAANADTFTARRSTWTGGGGIGLAGKQVDLSGASLRAAGPLAVSAGTLDASDMEAASGTDLSLSASAGGLQLARARLFAVQDLHAGGTHTASMAGATLQAGRDVLLASGGPLDLTAPSLHLQYGRALNVRAEGIKAAGVRLGGTDIVLDAGDGALALQGAELSTRGAVTLRGQGIDNKVGRIVSQAALVADARDGVLDNTDGVLYEARNSAAISGSTVLNTRGVLGAAKGLSIRAGTLDNGDGVALASGGDLSVEARGALRNAGGQLVSEAGALRLRAQGIDNRKGFIGVAGLGELDAAQGVFDNREGVFTAQVVRASGEVQNAEGVISGRASVSLRTRTLDNESGVIEAGTDGLRIDTQGHRLDNRGSGGTRGIVSQGDVTISAGELDNRAGYIGAGGKLAVNSASRLLNQRGGILGLGDSQLHATDLIDNRGGSIASGRDLALATATLDNRGPGSSIVALRDLHLRAEAIRNEGTLGQDHQAGLRAGRHLGIDAGHLQNEGGAIAAQGDTRVRAGVVDNSQGHIAGDLTSLDAALLANGGGRMDARKQLGMSLQQMVGAGLLAAGGDLSLALAGNYEHRGEFAAGGHLDLRVAGTLSNQGSLQARRALQLRAAQLSNRSGAEISAPSVLLDVEGSLVNEGLINASAGLAELRAGQVDNSGRIYGDEIRIDASRVDNRLAANGLGGVIASRLAGLRIDGRLDNAPQALVYSGADLLVNGPVRNTGGTISAQRHIDIRGRLDNLNADLRTGVDTKHEPRAEFYIRPNGSTEQFRRDTLGWTGYEGGKWVLPSERYPLAKYGTEFLNSRTCQANGDTGGEECWLPYTGDDPIWARFGIGAPGLKPVVDPCLPGDGSSAARITHGACADTWERHEAYPAKLKAAYDQLDVAIGAFNADLHGRYVTDWFEEDVTGRTTRQTVVVASEPGRVLAGGDIRADSGLNQDSVVVAGGVLSGAIQNAASKGVRETSQEGTVVFNLHTWRGGNDGRERSAPSPLVRVPRAESFDLPIMVSRSGARAPMPSAGDAVAAPIAAAQVPGWAGSTQALRHAAGAAAVAAPPAPSAAPVEPPEVVRVDAPAMEVPGTAPALAAVAVASPRPTPTVTPDAPAGPAGPSVTLTQAAAPRPALSGSLIAASASSAQRGAIDAVRIELASMAPKAAVAAPILTDARRPSSPAPSKAAGFTTIAARGPVSVPANQLFRLGTGPGGPLVRTDATFVGGLRYTASSDYFDAFRLDPSYTLRVYGDGFAEQRLIDDQIVALTGRRFLSDHQSSEDQYRALLDAGAMFASQYQLSPGVSLTAEQMAALTTDIVWLEARAVVLPDGSTTEAFVPTVYLRRPEQGDLCPEGSLLSGRDVSLRSTGDLTNTGTVMAYGWDDANDGRLDVAAANIINRGTLAGNQLDLSAKATLDSSGGDVQGLGSDSWARMNARNIVLRATTRTDEARAEGPHGTSVARATQIDRFATITADKVVMAALEDVVMEGAFVRANHALAVDAGRNVRLGAAVTGYELHVPLGGVGGTVAGRSGHYKEEGTRHVGTQLLSGGQALISAGGTVTLIGSRVRAERTLDIDAERVEVRAALDRQAIDLQSVHRQGFERIAESAQSLVGGELSAGGNLTVLARRDIDARGANITSDQGRAALIAGGNLHIGALETEYTQDSEHFSSRRNSFGSRSRVAEGHTTASTAEGSLVSGQTVHLQAGKVGEDGRLRDGAIDIEASTVVGQRDVSILAGRVRIAATTSSETGSQYDQRRSSGIGALDGASVGTQSQMTDQQFSRTKAVGSTIGSLEGNVRIQATEGVAIVGSQVIAPKGDIAIRGKAVSITEARETGAAKETRKSKQAGISVAASHPIVEAARTVGRMASAAGKTDAPRMMALAAVTAGLALNEVAGQLADPKLASGGVSITLGRRADRRSTGH